MTQGTLDTIQELTRVMENVEIHHTSRDGDWLRPQDLRLILRLIQQALMELTDGR